MKFNLWTILFQIINFVVLLFILRRIFFKPVREIMEKRRALIAETIASAEKTKKEAEDLKKVNEEAMEAIRKERVRMTEDMREEIAGERKRLLGAAEDEAARIIEKERALFEAEVKRTKAGIRDTAIDTASLYASRLMSDIADQPLHDAIVRKLREDLGRIGTEIRGRMASDSVVPVELASAWPLTEEDVSDLRKSLEKEIGRSIELRTGTEKSLMAGLVLKAYDMVYDLSLAGQIQSFSSRLREKA